MAVVHGGMAHGLERAPGKLADIVILDGDIEATAPTALSEMGIRMTICGGRTSYSAT